MRVTPRISDNKGENDSPISKFDNESDHQTEALTSKQFILLDKNLPTSSSPSLQPKYYPNSA